MATSSASREPLVPTINFSMVCPGVYRSGYPTKKNYSFLRALRLRSILYLCPEDYAEGNLKFCEESGIHVWRFPTEGNKEPFSDISEPLMHRILSALCDTRNLPLLIHCNKGKHRTGTVVACLRHLQGWSLVSIFEEYKRFASDKARVGDQQYVELYHPIVKLTPPFVAPWVTLTPRVTLVTSDRELVEAESVQLGYSLLAPDKAPKKAGKTAAAAAPPPPSTAAVPAAPSSSANNTNINTVVVSPASAGAGAGGGVAASATTAGFAVGKSQSAQVTSSSQQQQQQNQQPATPASGSGVASGIHSSPPPPPPQQQQQQHSMSSTTAGQGVGPVDT